MKSTVFELLALASALLIALLGILIPMTIRRRRNGGNLFSYDKLIPAIHALRNIENERIPNL